VGRREEDGEKCRKRSRRRHVRRTAKMIPVYHVLGSREDVVFHLSSISTKP
jgi:hypothetical protein